MVEARREQIAHRAKQAMAHYRRGNVERGNVKELYQDLESGYTRLGRGVQNKLPKE